MSGTETPRIVGLRRRGREDRYLGPERTAQLDCEVARTPEAYDSQARSRSDPRLTKRLPHRDARTHQRSGGSRVKPGRKLVYEVVADDDAL